MTVTACPECDVANFKKRETKSPPYRCINGHTFEEPKERGSNRVNGGRPAAEEMYGCYKCGETFSSKAQRNRVKCPECGKQLICWRASIAFAGENKMIQELSDGPHAGYVNIPPHLRDMIHTIKAPKGSPGATKPRGTKKNVYYLPGDEREAIRTFIEANEAYVRGCLEDPTNPMQMNWSDEMYQLLVEQWEWGKD